jgi:tripartite-type tricarboxylate transporter receptor subunit TctC
MNRYLKNLLGICIAVGTAFSAHAQWPDRAIKIVVPYPAANSSDVAARLIGEKLAAQLGQPVIVENRAGASGTLGTAYAAKQPADGYTLAIGAPGPLSVGPWTTVRPLPYDPVNDFVVVGAIVWAPQVLVAKKDLPVKNFQEFLAYAKKPGATLSYGSSGVGTVPQLIVSQMLKQTGIKAEHVPYRGGAPAITDLRGGVIDFMSDTVPVVRGMIAEGTIKALGVSTAERIPSLPDVPTLQEQGVKDFNLQGYILLVAPAKTPDQIVFRLRNAMDSIVKESDVRKRLLELGLTPMELPRERFATFLQTESVPLEGCS